jgi:hypothetical protein
MSRRRKKCRCCHELFQPHAQSYRQQITCDKAACRAWRRRWKWRRWAAKNPLYGMSRLGKQKAWREKNGAAYMRGYRQTHAGYVAGNRRLQRQRDRERRHLVKPTEWGLICREKSTRIRRLHMLVKPTEWPAVLRQEIDGIWRVLSRSWMLVKPTDMDQRR